MSNSTFIPVCGIIQSISPFSNLCCSQLISLSTSGGPINFVISRNTYICGHILLRPGMHITAFYHSSVPVPLIYPPQYQAIAVVPVSPDGSVMVEYFDQNLLAIDGSLKLNLSPATHIVTANGQLYPCDPGGNLLIVYYRATTRSIPPQTTPDKIIVLC